jgi:outer membrane lipase/esterase
MIKKKLLPALLCSALAAASASSHAVQFSGVYIFGDSLSDAGIYKPGIAALLGAQAGAALGHFTTNPGPVWSELVSQYYGYTPGPSNVTGGNIYAQGGQRVSDPTPASLMGPGGTQRPVSTQITEYLGRGSIDANALYGVWIGANDVFTQLGALSAGAITQAQLQTNVLGAANAEIGQIGRLTVGGARYVMVFAIPDIGSTPAFATNPLAPSITQLVAGYNTTLFTGLQASNMRVIPVDTFTLLNEIRANPAPYGFTNITTPACDLAVTSGTSLFCAGNTLVAPNAQNTYLFADGVHPTTAAHRIIADFAISLIDGPQQMSLLAETPLRTREGHIRTLDAGLQSAQSNATGKFSAFAAADGGNFDLNSSGSSPGIDSRNRNVTVGITMRASEGFTVGVGVGQSTATANFGNGLGNFNTRENVLSVFGVAKSGGLYANGSVSVADINFNSIHRNINLGPATRVATGNTDGSNASSSLGVGYDLSLGKISAGPFVSITSQNVEVNAFSEEGAGSAGLKIGGQKRVSRVTSAGVRASMDMGSFTPFARFSYDQEHNNKDREVLATPLSVASGNTYGIPAFRGDDKWGTATIGVRAGFGGNLGLSVIYSSVLSRQDVKQDALTANVTYKF